MSKLVIFLHGYGANGADLIGLKEYIDNKNGNILFESPNAPEPCPLNYFGFQWFDLVERTPEEIYLGLQKAFNYLDKIISNLCKKYQLSNEEILLVGFSQGAMLATYYGLKSKNNLAGIISLSGGLPKEIFQDLDFINTSQNYSIIHGKSDSVVPYQRSVDLSQFLNDKNILNNITLQENQEHGINEDAIKIIQTKVALLL